MGLLDFPGAAQRMGFKSRTFVYEQLADGTLPKPVRFGERAVRFPSDEIDAVIAARIAGKSKAEIRTLVKQLEADRTKALQPAPEAKAPASPLSLAGV